MELLRDAPLQNAAAHAKATLRRLALAQLEPTPENYARAWAEELGSPATPAAGDGKAQGPAWAALIERLVRHLERPGKQWTTARRKDSLLRVLQGSRSDGERLLQRLQSLVQAWESDRVDASDPVEAPATPGPADATSPPMAPALGAAPADAPDRPAPLPVRASPDRPADPASASRVREVPARFATSLRRGLPADDARARELADALGALAARIGTEGASAEVADAAEQLCRRVDAFFGHRHELVAQLGGLCRELGSSLTALAEDESWARGQCEQLEQRLGDGLSRRALQAAGELLAEARRQQQRLRAERAAAREALKQALAGMLSEVGALGEQAGVFERAVQRHAEAIARADNLEGLAGVAQAMLEDSRKVRSQVQAAQQRLQAQRDHADELRARVLELESELRRISEEASTDALTQVANRRGLEAAFAVEAARAQRGDTAVLAVALIDIDNFKKLNDRLGHAAGDQALRSLAAAVRERLRPADHLARFGGEEFVVLLPDTEIEAAQQTLTRLQRGLSAALFLHEGEEVFVTFSAGVTCWRPGEALEAALERADEALYEAKRTGKNRTCQA